MDEFESLNAALINGEKEKLYNLISDMGLNGDSPDLKRIWENANDRIKVAPTVPAYRYHPRFTAMTELVRDLSEDFPNVQIPHRPPRRPVRRNMQG